MDTQPCRPDEAMVSDVAERDRDLETRSEPEMPVQTLDLVAGLIAGMTHIGRFSR